jgi:hypothetical protein
MDRIPPQRGIAHAAEVNCRKPFQPNLGEVEAANLSRPAILAGRLAGAMKLDGFQNAGFIEFSAFLWYWCTICFSNKMQALWRSF